MPRPYLSALIVLAILSLISAGVFLLKKQSAPLRVERGTKLSVAATIYPLYDLARQVAGGYADVALIVPPGASDENFQVSPADVGRLSGVRAIFSIGHGLDTWALDVAGALNGSDVVTVDTGIALRANTVNEDAQTDPHYWLSFGNARKIVDTIAASLSAYDPDNSQEYAKNAENVRNELSIEEVELKKILAPYADAPLLVFHDAWYYFADAFGLSIAGVFKQSAADEPSPRNLANLKKVIQEKNISTLFIEPQISSAAVDGFVEDNNLSIAELDPVGGTVGRLTYGELMRYNIEEIVRALSKKNENTQRN